MVLANLQILFFVVIILSIIMYTVLDGFDLGVGMLHPFAKTDHDRRVFLNAIGPVWDGNEVWLVVIVGGTFAGFPIVYASILSSFYLFIVLLLAGFMFRAAAIEFRSKNKSPKWRTSWDVVFSVASYLLAFSIGVALGNFIQGLPLNENHEFYGSFALFFRPYPLIVGILSVSLFMMHGAIFLLMKTEGELHDKIRSWANPMIAFFVVMFLITTIYTFVEIPHMVRPFFEYYPLFFFPLVMVGLFIYLFRNIQRTYDGWAFICSCIIIALFLVLFTVGIYPYLLFSTIDPEHNSLTIYNSSSSAGTLKILLTVVLIGIPLVIAYGIWAYHIFKGKVKIDETSY